MRGEVENLIIARESQITRVALGLIRRDLEFTLEAEKPAVEGLRGVSCLGNNLVDSPYLLCYS
jgi:hypothetical protein